MMLAAAAAAAAGAHRYLFDGKSHDSSLHCRAQPFTSAQVTALARYPHFFVDIMMVQELGQAIPDSQPHQNGE
jgi:hypothetical protein